MGGAESACDCCSQRNKAGDGSKPGRPGYAQPVGTSPAAVGEPAPAATGRKRALLVGCNYPGSQAELSGCINDVLRMGGLLQGRFGFAREDLCVLLDDGDSPQGRPTRNAVLDGMRWLVEGARPGDALFFHFSGHGGQQQDPSYAEEDGYDETILPTDFQAAGMIVDDEVFDLLCAPLPSGCKLTAVMDCCHSGTGLDLPFIWQAGGWASQGGGWQEEDNPCHSAGDVMLVSGCMDEQTSADATGNRGEAAGALTTALVDSIEEGGGRSVAELLRATREKLRERGFEQVPNLTASQRFDAEKRVFDMVEGFQSNGNPVVGRHFRKAKHPKRDFPADFDTLIIAAEAAFFLVPLAAQMAAQAEGPVPAAEDGGFIEEEPEAGETGEAAACDACFDMEEED